MIRTKCLVVLFLAGSAAAVGCDGASSAAKNDMPIKTSEGADKKGHKTKMMEAGLAIEPEKK